TVNTNLASGGTVTKTRLYPKGATVTLKVKPATGKLFQYWMDSKGKNIATAQRHTFVQDTLEQSFTAMFQGGSSEIVNASPRPSMRLDGRKLTGLRGVEAGLFDARGNRLGHSNGKLDELDLSALPVGAYWVCSSRPGQEPFGFTLTK
ncbi:MAG: hypothetical protein AAB214_18555, partial [Fibrobacterota bacterium]